MSQHPSTGVEKSPQVRGWRLLLMLTLATTPRHAHSEVAAASPAPALMDNMDGRRPVLQLLDVSSSVKLVSQAVEPNQGQFGHASERMVLSAPAGSSARLAYDLPTAPVIQELKFTAWVTCNRPGVQLAATVVLPRSIDPLTGSPRTLLLRAGKTGGGGQPELITLEDLPAHLADQSRVARATQRGDIDERGAFVTQLIFLVPGGPGTTELLVDQISVYGVLNGAPSSIESADDDAVTLVAHERPAAASMPAPRRPTLARVIQWQGEPLEMLRRIGFDAVWMGRLPTDEELAEANRLGMYLVCPPPLPGALSSEGIAAKYAPIIAWDLGQLTDQADIGLVHRWAQAIEIAETDPRREVLLEPFGMTREASRIADVLMLGRPKLGSSQTWTDYATWLAQQQRLAKPGTPAWVNVETHCSGRFAGQLASLRRSSESAAAPASFHELSRATTAAFGVSPRGFCFQSHASLAGGETDNKLRALALELTNLRLGLAEPWLAGGRITTAARSTRPELTGLVLKVERSHLIVPLRWDAAGGELVADARQPIAFDLPGAPESCDAYLVSISGSQRLQGRRVTGGLRVSLDHLPDDAFILVTEDGYAFSHVERYLREHAPRATQVRVELAALRRQQAARAIAALPTSVVEQSGVAPELKQVDAQMTAVVETMRRNDHAAAFACAAEAERLLDVALERLADVVAPDLPPGVAPIPAGWSTLVDLAAVQRALAGGNNPPHLVPGGEFEDLPSLVTGGWQRVQQTTAGVETSVRLSPEAPVRGKYCLELEVRSTGNGPPALARPPVWVTSPPVRVPGGQLIEIMGMVRMIETPIGSADPLLIFDSVGGEESAVRIVSSPSWTPFRLVRATPADGEIRITIALGGEGRAQIDSLAYRLVPQPNDTLARTPDLSR